MAIVYPPTESKRRELLDALIESLTRAIMDPDSEYFVAANPRSHLPFAVSIRSDYCLSIEVSNKSEDAIVSPKLKDLLLHAEDV